MKRFFNHTKKPVNNREDYNESDYDWEQTENYEEAEYYEEDSQGEYYAEEDYVTEDEYYAEEEGYEAEGEYYTEEEGYEAEGEYYAEEEGYEAEGEYYAEEGYYAEDEYYTEEEAYYAEDGYYEEEEYYPQPVYPKSFLEKIRDIFGNMAVKDRAITVTGIVVLILALVAGGLYISAASDKAAVSVLATVGSQLEGIDMIGKEGLLAVADAQKARLAAAELLEQQEQQEKIEYNENEYSDVITVKLNMTSVKKDLKLKFTNEKTGKLISNVPFSVTVTLPGGKSFTWSDDDMDGIIYKKNITPGEYEVLINELSGETYKNYIISTEVQTVEVKKDIAYEKIDVSDEVKTEDEIDVSQEDTKIKETEEQSALQDTVDWVESTVIAEIYTEVPKSDVSDPDDLGTTSGGDAESSTSSSDEKLKDTSAAQLYVLENDSYREAVYADYDTFDKFYVKGEAKYTGWQTIDGKTYYYNAEGEKVTGEQIIQGVKYNFASDGSLVTDDGALGIDVSKWNGTIDWKAVKNSGVSYVIIRCGYRGSTQGMLIEDPLFNTNIKGAIEAGLKVGVYFFSQATDEIEAVEEASYVLDKVKNYKLSYPVFLDVEPSGGRGDKIDKATRTAVCKAFCETIQRAGYTAGIYANKTWLDEKIDASQLSAYKIWLAQYAATPTYTGRYDMWQYTSKGKINGISGDVDLNTSYLGY